MMTYSIIIPHRDIPQLLQRCLDSIPQRPDLEVIVVDDNSNPELVNFSHFPGLERSDTTIIFDKSGRGAGRARNVGMEYAKGKWLLFADADDFFSYCLDDVLNEYTDCEADIVFFRASSLDSDYYTNTKRANDYNGYFQKYADDAAMGEMLLRYVAGVPWGKIIRRKIVSERGIRFQETTILNDSKFSYLTGHYAKTIIVDARAIYCMTYRSDSITYTLTDEKILDRARVLAERERFFLDHNLPVALKWLQWEARSLIKLKEQGKKLLYDKCLNIFSEYGITNATIEKLIAQEQTRRRKAKRQKFVNKWMGRLGLRPFK